MVVTYIKEDLKPKLIFASQDRRILMAEIQRGKEKTLIVNIYAPNKNQDNFFKELQKELADKEYKYICCIRH